MSHSEVQPRSATQVQPDGRSATHNTGNNRFKGCRLHLGCTSSDTKCNPTKPLYFNDSSPKGCTLHFNPIATHMNKQRFYLKNVLQRSDSKRSATCNPSDKTDTPEKGGEPS